MANDYIVKPVYKALQVLRCLGDERRELTLSELSYRLGMPKTTVFRYLRTLCACGFVSHDSNTDLYRIGLRVWELGRLSQSLVHLRELALPVMRELRDQFNETVNLGVLDGVEVVYLEMVESRRSLRMQAQYGGRDPIYSTALGKAILSGLPEAQWPPYLPARLTAQTPKTITSLPALHDELRLSRERGFALDDEENEEGARCVAAPIRGADGQACSAISVSAPVLRADERRLPNIVAGTRRAAADISRLLGYRRTAP